MQQQSELLIEGNVLDPKVWKLILPSLQIHSVITDPPFYAQKAGFRQIRKKNKNQLAEIPVPEDYEAFWHEVCRQAAARIDKSGWFIYKADFHTLIKTHEITSQYFDFVADTVWDKIRIGTGYYIRKQHEFILIYRPKGAKNSFSLQRPRKNQLRSSSHGNSKGKAFRSVQRLLNSNGGVFGSSPRSHINQTESELWERYITYFVPEGSIILDPFMGSGSVGVAAKRLNRGYVGIEVVPEFYEIAERHIANVSNTRLISSFLTNHTTT